MVITSALHAEGLGFNPRRDYITKRKTKRKKESIRGAMVARKTSDLKAAGSSPVGCENKMNAKKGDMVYI